MGRPVEVRLALVVEDDTDVRDLAVALLEETELDVVTCESAEAALAVLETRGDDVAMLFTDVRLAGAMDGLALADAATRRWPGTRVVVTSGYGDQGRLPQRAVYVQKPWRALDVLMQADRAVRPSRPVLRAIS